MAEKIKIKNMLKNLTNFSYKRSWKEALGFYLTYLLVSISLGGIGDMFFGILSRALIIDRNFYSSANIGTMIIILFCLIIACMVLTRRKLYANFGYVILVLLSGILASFGGSLLGLIIPAFMTTRDITFTETS